MTPRLQFIITIIIFTIFIFTIIIIYYYHMIVIQKTKKTATKKHRLIIVILTPIINTQLLSYYNCNNKTKKNPPYGSCWHSELVMVPGISGMSFKYLSSLCLKVSIRLLHWSDAICPPVQVMQLVSSYIVMDPGKRNLMFWLFLIHAGA